MKVIKVTKKIAYILQIIMSIALVVVAFISHVIPENYIISAILILGLFLFLEYILLFFKGRKRCKCIATQIFSFLISICLGVSSFYIYTVASTVDLMTSESFQQRAISVIVLKDSKIKNESDIDNHKIGYVSAVDNTTMTYALSNLHNNFSKIETQDFEDFEEMTNQLYDEKVDMILLDEAFRNIVEQTHKDFSDETRIVYQITKDESLVNAKNVDVLKKPFLIYISGNDNYGELTAVSRSDVNMLAVVNPNTYQILLVSIPRDSYVPLNRNGQYDKFTHTGMYGLEESIKTLEDMVDENINYYVRMNFTSFMSVIDAIGGITINSPYEFTTKIGNYHIEKGENTLNAKQALGFVRERKSFQDGDFARGRNQQLMIKAIFDKICSPSIITTFPSILKAVGNSFETNMTSNEINSLFEMQLEKMPTWDIQSYQITGDTGSMPCYSSGGNASVVIPSELSIQKAHDYIDSMMDGEKITIESAQ